MRARIALLLILPTFLSACGSNSSNSSNNGSQSTSTGELSGNWQISLLPFNTSGNLNSQSGFLLQNGETVTGGIIFNDSPCSGVGAVSGAVSGAGVTLVANPVGTQINLNGVIASGPTSMGGQYTLLSTGCTGGVVPQTGTWIADLVAPLNGTVSGSLSSQSGPSYILSGQLSQGPNSGGSSASLTGTLSIAGYCVSTVNITGSISGTALTLNLVNSDGTQAGQISATTSLDGTTVSGTYNTSCGQSVDAGTVRFTL